jgi:hypothetical protein
MLAPPSFFSIYVVDKMLMICLSSSADYMQGTRMQFRTQEDAIHFAEKQGGFLLLSPTFIRLKRADWACAQAGITTSNLLR